MMEVCELWRFNCNLPSQSRCVLWVPMTSPSSMLVPDHCVCKGQHSNSMFDDSWTRSYLPGAWEKFSGNVTISIINLSHMCAYSASLQLKKKIYRGDRTQQDTTWHLGKGGTEWDNPPHRFQTGWCWSPISGSYLGYWACRIYIYRWMFGPFWIHIIYFCLGLGLEITGKTLFFSHVFFISHSQHCLKMCVSCC